MAWDKKIIHCIIFYCVSVNINFNMCVWTVESLGRYDTSEHMWTVRTTFKEGRILFHCLSSAREIYLGYKSMEFFEVGNNNGNVYLNFYKWFTRINVHTFLCELSLICTTVFLNYCTNFGYNTAECFSNSVSSSAYKLWFTPLAWMMRYTGDTYALNKRGRILEGPQYWLCLYFRHVFAYNCLAMKFE